MIEEMKKEFEHKFTHLDNLGGSRSMATVNADRVWRWFESKLKQEIESACKKQREIINHEVKEALWMPHNLSVENLILNAPSPLDEVK